MSTQNGVIETATGDLLRAGPGVDFVNDGSFNSDTEGQRTDVPVPGKVRGDVNFANHHRWNGSVWVEVAQPTAMPARAGAMHQLRMSFNNEGRTKIRPLVDGTSQTFTDVDLSSFVPTTSEFVFLLASFETGGSGLAGNNAELRVDGATSSNPAFQIGIGVVSDKKADSQVSMPCSSAQKIEYAVTDSDNNKLTLIVPGYEDRL